MFCWNCGTEIPAEGRGCNACGAPRTRPAPAPVEVEPLVEVEDLRAKEPAPPPPPQVVGTGPARPEGLSVAASLTTVCLLADAVLALATAALGFAVHRALEDPDADRSFFWFLAAWCLLLLSGGSTLLAFLAWIHGATSRAAEVSRPQVLGFEPQWAVLCHFVPVVNLVQPARVVSQLWRASEPTVARGGDFSRERASALVSPWWLSVVGACVLGSVAAFAVGRLEVDATGRIGPGDLPALDQGLQLLVASDFLVVIACFLGLELVRGIDRRLSARQAGGAASDR
jgi:hypothetical protein